MRAMISLIERGPVGGGKRRRPPPIITLQRMVSQVDQLVGWPEGEVALGHGAGETLMRWASAAWPGERVTSHTSVPERSPALTAACTTGRETTRSPRPNDTGAMNRRRTSAHDAAYTLVSGIPSSLKAS